MKNNISNYESVLENLYNYLKNIGIIYEDFSECDCAYENIKEYVVEGFGEGDVKLIWDDNFSYTWNIDRAVETLYDELKLMFKNIK